MFCCHVVLSQLGDKLKHDFIQKDFQIKPQSAAPFSFSLFFFLSDIIKLSLL